MKSFLEGRPTVVKERTEAPRPASMTNYALPAFGQTPKPIERESERQAAPLPQDSRHGAAKVETVEEEGVVRKIVVVCSCGDRIEIHCGY